MLEFVPRAILAALLMTFICAVPSAARVGNGKIAFVTANGLYTINFDGTGRTLLKADPGINPFESPRWSPDGSRIAFVDLHGVGDRRLIVMDADGGNEHVVATAGGTALSRQPWSPDSSRIAWADVEAGDVYTANASGGDVRRLTFQGGMNSPPSWSPTGSTLVASRRTRPPFPDGVLLIVIGADGSGDRQITPPGSFSAHPTWSPSGEWIAFVSRPNTGVSGVAVSLVRPDGSDLHPVAFGDRGCACYSPTWSPDGSRIAFGDYLLGRTKPVRADVYVVDADGSHLKRLNAAPDAKYASAPVWSPDGDRLLFHSRGLVTANADGTCQMHLTGDAPYGGPYDTEISSWQPIPDGPPAGRARCYAIAVTGTVSANTPAAVVIGATVVNEGTDPLTKVILEVPAHDAVSPAAASRGCTIRRGKVTCRLGRLAPGDSHRVSIRLEARRVRPTGRITKLPARIKGDASERLLLSGREETYVTVAISRCTDRDRGGGTIRGTSSADRICGRRGADRIYPGPGSDVVKAGGGNDVILAVDGRRHRDRISCGRGSDRVEADRRDRVSHDCEHVTRR